MSAKKLISKPAPAFKLSDHNGQEYEVKPGQSGLPLVIFYYPESGSFGCTKEACHFRDAVAEKADFSPEKVQVIGVSPDPVAKQKAFVEKEKLTYPVLSDAKKEVASAYGIGRGMFGLSPVARVTFVIDKKGIVRDVLDATMNYSAHIKFVEKALKRINTEEEAESRANVPKDQKGAAEAEGRTAGEGQTQPAPESTPAPAPTIPAPAPVPVPAPVDAPVAAPLSAPEIEVRAIPAKMGDKGAVASNAPDNEADE